MHFRLHLQALQLGIVQPSGKLGTCAGPGTSAAHLVSVYRPLDHFRAATQLFQELEDWKLAAEAQYLVAMVCDTAHLQSQRNLSAAGCLHLQSLAAAA